MVSKPFVAGLTTENKLPPKWRLRISTRLSGHCCPAVLSSASDICSGVEDIDHVSKNMALPIITVITWTYSNMRQLATAINGHNVTTIVTRRKLKRLQAEKYPDPRENRLQDKTLRIQKFSDSKFPFKISENTIKPGSFLLWILPLVSKRQNQAGTETFSSKVCGSQNISVLSP